MGFRFRGDGGLELRQDEVIQAHAPGFRCLLQQLGKFAAGKSQMHLRWLGVTSAGAVLVF